MKTDSGFGKKFAEFLLEHRGKVLFGLIALVFAMAAGMKNIQMNSQYRYFFGEDNPELQEFEKLQRVYAKEDNLLMVVTPKDGEVFKKRTLKAVEWLTEKAWKTPFSTRVDSITNYQYTEANEDDLTVRKLVEDAESLTPELIATVKRVAMKEPILVGQIMSRKGHVTAVNVQTNIPGKAPMEVPDTANFARELAKEFSEKFPDHEIRLSGVLMLNNAFVEAGMRDMMSLTPIMYLVILVILAFLLRSISSVIATLVVIFLSILGGMGFAGWAGIPISPPSAIAPTVILTLAIADSIHYLMSMLTEMRKGMSKRDAIIESMHLNLLPIFLTSVTTIIGFLSLNASDSPPYHDLGNITAMGVAVAFILSVTVLPILMSYMPVKVKVREDKKVGSPFFEGLSEILIRHKTAIAAVMLLITLGMTTQIFNLKVNDQFVQYFDHTVPFRVQTDYVMDNLTGIYQVEMDVKSKGPQGVTDPEYLANLEKFANYLREKDLVAHVSIFTDVMKKVNRSMHGDDNSYYKIPDDKELAAQYLLLYEMSLPFGLDLNNQVNLDKSSTRVVFTMNDIDTKELLAFVGKVEKWTQSNLPNYMQAKASGPTVMFSHITERNIAGMVKGTFIAFFLITLIMIISLRSIKYGLISLFPNMIPAALAFGVWSLFKGEVGFSISVVTSVTLGIIVDDTVHFLSKYVLKKRSGQLDSEESVREAFRNVGPALTVTSVVLTIGFGILILSPFNLNNTLGLLSALTIVIALVVDFLLLPALLLLIDGKPKTVKTQMTATGEA